MDIRHARINDVAKRGEENGKNLRNNSDFISLYLLATNAEIALGESRRIRNVTTIYCLYRNNRKLG